MTFGKFFGAIATIVLAAATMFAQDGNTKVNFINQTSSTLRFMLNGSPACAGDIIPNGSCTESVNPGTYTASATDGQQSTGGKTFSIAYGETYNYRVYEDQSLAAPVRSGMKLAALQSVGVFTNNYFSTNFVGQVETSQARNDSNTSSQYYFDAHNDNVLQSVDIRLVDHDIPYGLDATNYYANDDFNRRQQSTPGATAGNRSTGVYQGHPFTYQVITYTINGVVFTERNRYIYINAREVYFVVQTSLAAYDDSSEWGTFANAMNIIR
jgi:hypothetical protein